MGWHGNLYGHTEGCPGCTAMKKRNYKYRRAHNTECRKIIMEILARDSNTGEQLKAKIHRHGVYHILSLSISSLALGSFRIASSPCSYVASLLCATPCPLTSRALVSPLFLSHMHRTMTYKACALPGVPQFQSLWVSLELGPLWVSFLPLVPLLGLAYPIPFLPLTPRLSFLSFLCGLPAPALDPRHQD